jgi:hypothetical protein
VGDISLRPRNKSNRLESLCLPDFIPQPDAVVIDEQFHEASIEKSKDETDGASKDKNPQVIDIDTLLTARIPDNCHHEKAAALAERREALHAAILANGTGPLSRDVLLAHGFSWEWAGWLSQLEKLTVDPKVLNPNMPTGELAKIARRNKDSYALAHALSALWAEIETFLGEGEYREAPKWARLTVKGKGAAEAIEVRRLRSMHDSWRAPTLILDATAPPVAVLQRFLDVGGLLDVVEKADITAQWSEHVHVRQIFGASVTMGKVGLFGEEKPENVRDILRYIRWRAALSYPADIGLITYKGLLENLQGKLPKNVTVTAHFGALAGLNSMERVAGLIVLGRPYIKPVAAEAFAEVFGGQPVAPVRKYYRNRPTTVRLANGTDYDVNNDFHQHPLAEALRWQTPGRGLLQAVGRLRPHRRTTPCWLDLVTDVLLPVPVYERVGWDDAMPRAFGDMADAGVILLNRRDVALAFDDLSERQGRANAGDNWVRSPIDYYIGDRTQLSALRCFSYRRQGARGRASTGYMLPAIIGGEATLRSWLEDKLGPLASLEIERRDVWMGGVVEREPVGMPLGELVGVIGGWLGEMPEGDDG